jgi:hypothetical protein
MAMALLALAQPKIWQAFNEDLRALGSLRRHEDEALVSVFGVCAHYVPLAELQELVRTWLTRDVLLGRDWGAVQVWRPAQVEPDEEAAASLLRKARHSFLNALAQTGSPAHRVTNWPSAHRADSVLALALRQHLQALANRSPPGNSLLLYDGLLAGMEEVFLRANAPFDAIEPLEKVIIQARQELRNWLNWLREANQRAKATIDHAQKQWERSLERIGWHSVLSKNAPEHTYEALINGASDIRQTIRRYVRWAWVLRENRLHLNLDTLYPGWGAGSSGWRHNFDTQAWPQLWEGVQYVVMALTRESSYWPSSLTAPDGTLPSPAQVQQAANLTLAYDTGTAQAIRSPIRVAYQTSGDKNWLERSWLRPGVSVSKFESFSPTLGFLLQAHHLIPLSAVQSLADLRRRYDQRRGMAHTWHIFKAEQLAARIENQALKTVPRRHRDNLITTRLTSRTVAALQQPTLVKLFVNAWLAGLVDPKFGPGPYRLLQPAPETKERQELCSLDANHPLQALHAFIQRDRQLAELEELINLIDETLETQSEEVHTRLDDIDGWWESPESRNVEWYLLVQGLNWE